MQRTEERSQERTISSVVDGLILNLLQEFGDLEYINFGSVLPSPSATKQRGGGAKYLSRQIQASKIATTEVLPDYSDAKMGRAGAARFQGKTLSRDGRDGGVHGNVARIGGWLAGRTGDGFAADADGRGRWASEVRGI